jgi:uncharacterized protein (TIGR02145 family)
MTPKRKFRKVAQQLGKSTMFAIIAMLIVSAVNAQKPKLAVMDFMAGVGLYQNDVNGLSDMLINSLFNTGRFELIERGQLCQLIGETNLQKSSLSAGQLQQLAIKGVNFLLLGTVNLTGGEYNIDIRVVDVGTGQLYSTAGVTKLSTQTYRDMMPKLANELATKLPQTVNATVTVNSTPIQEIISSGKGIEIDGLIWAVGNVGSGGFVRPNQYGFYLTYEQAKNACPQGWRLPTKVEFETLIRRRKTKNNDFDIKGGHDFGIGERTIFLPYTGTQFNGDISGQGIGGSYWTSTADNGLLYGPGIYVLEFNTMLDPRLISYYKGQYASCRCVLDE